jgi:hypothetical protein
MKAGNFGFKIANSTVGKPPVLEQTLSNSCLHFAGKLYIPALFNS